MVAAIALGVLIGLALGALGGGGSILAVPVLVYVAGQDPKAATATSLVAVASAAAVGAVNHARAGNVRWKPAIAFILTAVPGSWLGSRVNEEINGDVLLLGFSVLVLIAAWRMLTACPSCTRAGEEVAVDADRLARARAGSGPSGAVLPEVAALGASPARSTTAEAPGDLDDLCGDPGSDLTELASDLAELPTWAQPHVGAEAGPGTDVAGRRVGHGLGAAAVAKVVAAGLVVGFLTGLFGVGGGFVIVPALTLALGLSMPEAIGTSLVVIVGNGLVALWFRGTGAVDWDVALPFTIAMLVGSLVGSAYGSRLPARQSLRYFAILLVLVAIGNGIAASYALWA
ncbi:MAG: sulfite exporter TauE/SafE family protein [Acidimicrobiales bacterium]